MKYISNDGTVYKSKKDYWLTMYPIRENEKDTNYLRRIKRILDSDYLEKINKNSREFMKNRYNNDETYREYQKNKSLQSYYKKQLEKI